MGIPRLDIAVIELNKPHTAFDEPAGDQELSCLHAGAVHLVNVFWFPRDVKRLGGRRLHAKGQLERFDARLEGGVFHPRLLMPPVESGQQVELPPLGRFRQRAIADVVDQLVDAGVPRIDVGSLKASRQEANRQFDTSETGSPGHMAMKPGRF